MKINPNISWLNSRKDTFILSGIDLFISILLALFFIKQFDLFPINFLIISFIWVFISYLSLRYYSDPNIYRLKKINSYFKATISSVLVSYLILTVFKKKLIYEKELFLLIIFIFSISLLSFLIVNVFLNNYKDKKDVLFIGNKEDHKYLIDLNNYTKNKFNIKLCSFEKFKKYKKNILDYEETIVSETKVIKYLNSLELKKYKVQIYSIKLWSEKFLEFTPSFLITEQEKIYIKKLALQSNTNFIKRMGDIIFSILLLILSFPIILVAAFFIFLEDRGPIFYSQIRTGLNNNEFRIWKLRTMHIAAELNGAIWASKNDKRITHIGKILRLTRIDEIPQLLNVLNGTMSLIGPRPERPELEKKLINGIDNYNLKTLVKPGLSGWAQVNYKYGASIKDTSIKVGFDIFYIKNFSIMLDLLIFVKTIKLVFNAEGSQPN